MEKFVLDCPRICLYKKKKKGLNNIERQKIQVIFVVYTKSWVHMDTYEEMIKSDKTREYLQPQGVCQTLICVCL